jgi:hypothetical protein
MSRTETPRGWLRRPCHIQTLRLSCRQMILQQTLTCLTLNHLVLLSGHQQTPCPLQIVLPFEQQALKALGPRLEFVNCLSRTLVYPPLSMAISTSRLKSLRPICWQAARRWRRKNQLLNTSLRTTCLHAGVAYLVQYPRMKTWTPRLP